jgi:hypothetical protein
VGELTLPTSGTVYLDANSFIHHNLVITISPHEILRCAQDDTTLSCHPERSEGSLRPARQTLRCAQGDSAIISKFLSSVTTFRPGLRNMI